MKICHFSDWHGALCEGGDPTEADLYVCTGDMYPNFPIRTYGRIFIDAHAEEQAQKSWAAGQGSWRKFLGSPDAPIIVVRGNHDFTEVAPMFGGEIYEIGLDSNTTFNVLGLKVGGFRGVNRIGCGWSDEFNQLEMDELARDLPLDLDILVTHSPPFDILDFYGQPLGSKAISAHLNNRKMKALAKASEDKPLLHCFGHIHEGAGVVKIENTTFSNASLRYNELEFP
jgi:Icc-related predicted phosphoesterase